MKGKLIAMSVIASLALGATAAKPVKAPAGGKKISNELIGIFFEDISMAADGGLCAELIQNGSFEFSPAEHDGWGAGTAWRSVRPGHSLGYIEPRQQDPIHPNNPNYLRLNIERVGHYYDYNGWTGVGIQNDGFDGILLKGGDKYDFSVFLRNPDGKDKEVRVVLTAPGQGFRSQARAIADTTIMVSGRNWKKYECTFTASEDCERASLQLLSLTTGVMDIDMVSLFPQDTYKGHGLRKDLAQALADLNPKFMRFPGGCVVHGGGDGFWATYRWKNTVGPREQRKGVKNPWGYHQSMEMGYFEYFQFCEDVGMEPLPILPCGVSCQGTNGGWNMRTQAQDVVPMSEMQEWVDEALDLIEWANGPATSKWGKVRADAGHPEPFNLKYLGLGNEEKITPEFEERFKYIYDRVREKYPEIIIVGTAGPGSHPGNGDYEEGWKFATQLEVPILDEHYYEQRNYFLTSRQYDSYPRDRKTKVYLGEYASKDKKLIDALAEGLYLLHVERNADIVVMTSYAPLFARKNTNNWNPDLIYFDNERPYLTCSYYVQQMFGQSSGDWYYGDCVSFDRADDNLLGQSVVLDTQSRKLYLKVCNAGENAAKANINLSRFGGFKSVTRTTIAGQPNDENGFDAQPVAPVTEDVKLKSKATLDVEPYSITLYSISL
ncbi:MAG: alpha-N-arabinofuranosidase [Bacteroidaceae bacterium]|nr:alpha-N-arabinofuranosidase [Bacteroidaceae bacterium]